MKKKVKIVFMNDEQISYLADGVIETDFVIAIRDYGWKKILVLTFFNGTIMLIKGTINDWLDKDNKNE